MSTAKITGARLIDGAQHALRLKTHVADAVAQLGRAPDHAQPGLAVVLVGDDPASAVYVRNKVAATQAAGMVSFEHRLPAETTQADLLALIARLNDDSAVDGILVQLPLPPPLDARAVIAAIAPTKDVDGLHAANAGLLATGQPGIVPCTPMGCMMLLRAELGELAGKTALVIGHSNLVGRPMARLLLNADCTVMVAHKASSNIPDLARQADIIVVAVGRPGLVQAEWIKPGAVVIDVGINRVAAPDLGPERTRLVGDVDFDAVRHVAGAITPVPGGVGPMTIACLLANTVAACLRARNLPVPAELSA